jgi:hypothetical protein
MSSWEVIEVQGYSVGRDDGENQGQEKAPERWIDIMPFKKGGKRVTEFSPSVTAVGVCTAQKVPPIFVVVAARGWTSRRRALFEFELLPLKGQQIIDHFNDKQSLQERDGKAAGVEQFPRDQIEDRRRPVMVAA